MHFFNENVKQIFIDATQLSDKLEKKYITFISLYYSAIKNSDIESILQDSKVNRDLLLEKLDEKLKQVPLRSDKDKLKLTVLVENFLSSCENDSDVRQKYINDKNLNVDKFYRANEAMFLLSLLVHLKFEEDEEVHEILDLTLEASECTSRKELLDILIKNTDKKLPKELKKDYLNTLYASRQSLAMSQNISDGYSNMDSFYGNPSEEKESKNTLESFTDNMNLLHKEGKLDTNVFHREDEIADIINILSKKKKSNPILLGDDGVGKTVIIDKLVDLIVSENPPESLKGKTIYRLDINRLVAGTKYRGDFENKMNKLLTKLKEDKNAILWIDEIHSIFSAGATSANGNDLVSILMPALSSGEIKCIGSTTKKVYNTVFSKSPSFSRRFQKVIIEEPNAIQMKQILRKIKTSYEEHHKVSYSDEIIDLTIALCDRYLHNLRFPDKAIDVIDIAGAQYSSGAKEGLNVTEKDIYEIISKRANIKITDSKKERENIANFENLLNKRVYGQSAAAQELTDVIHVAKSNLNNDLKPYGTFLFLGPTGVGKTEIVNAMAEILDMKLHRFDMSEFSEKHTVSKLFGSPPGYVGYEQGGQLTEMVERDPYSIVLLDEIEKAHPNIFDSLLQVLDNGFMTDGTGKKISFRNTIIVMTSNLGVKDSQLRKNMGFGISNNDTSINFEINPEELNKTFSPEFLNRLSAIVPFNYLGEDVILKVVDKFLKELSQRMENSNVVINVTPSARKILAKNGYDKLMGARPMERLINQKIIRPASKEILFGNLVNGGEIKIDSDNDEIVFTSSSK